MRSAPGNAAAAATGEAVAAGAMVPAEPATGDATAVCARLLTFPSWGLVALILACENIERHTLDNSMILYNIKYIIVWNILRVHAISKPKSRTFKKV